MHAVELTIATILDLVYVISESFEDSARAAPSETEFLALVKVESGQPDEIALGETGKFASGCRISGILAMFDQI